MHSIEIDDEVMAFLQSRAVPFVDTPNAVLRRELLRPSETRPGRAPLQAPASPEAKQYVGGITLPFGAPEALIQTLEVVAYMRRAGIDRSRATHFVAKQHGVARETVSDKYCRQLSLTAAQLDRLLSEPDLTQFGARLCSKFRGFEQDIRRILASLPKRTL